jgi:SAM-dependent methyltransferase
MTLLACADRLIKEKIIVPDETAFLDLGCADGRVNLFFSYLVRLSVGIELDEWTLDEYGPLRSHLEVLLKKEGLPPPPENIFLFHGDSTDRRVHDSVVRRTGLGVESFDLFYTYLVMHDAFAEMLAERARKGAIFMVYGLDAILPQYPGFRLLRHLSPMEGILALYEKV